MNDDDKKLGMDVPITRRDFINGTAVTVGATLASPIVVAGSTDAQAVSGDYPPAKTGMRGAHPGSFETAHAAVRGQHWQGKPSGEHYDLVIVGAGISGLAAAHIYLRDVDSKASILILDNHDDFGGHAKRNEFTSGNRTLLGFGGTMFIDAPKGYPPAAAAVLKDLGIEADLYKNHYHADLFDNLGLTGCAFLDRETFGADFLTSGTYVSPQALKESPLPQEIRDELVRLYADETDYLPGKSATQRRAIVESISWRDFLAQYGKFSETTLDFVQKWPHGVWAIGADACPAWLAYNEGYPGFAGMDLGYNDDEGPADHSVFSFPDGNATIARLLVRKLVPGIAPGNGIDDIVLAHFDYEALDAPDKQTRIRLNSTVVHLQHKDKDLSGDVELTYVTNGQAHSVSGSRVIWSGYHSMLPTVCPDIPSEQLAEQSNCERAPLVYTNVLIRNWTSVAELRIKRAYCPGSFFHTIMLGRPTSYGAYRYPTSPEEPMVLHMQHIPLKTGLSAPEQFRAGRRDLLGMDFEVFERAVRDQLGRVLGPAGFNPARDIEAITVNRWPHGYAYSVDRKSGEVAWYPDDWEEEDRTWVGASRRVGNIAFAGTDAASNAMSEAAIEEAHRAVESLGRVTPAKNS